MSQLYDVVAKMLMQARRTEIEWTFENKRQLSHSFLSNEIAPGVLGEVLNSPHRVEEQSSYEEWEKETKSRVKKVKMNT